MPIISHIEDILVFLATIIGIVFYKRIKFQYIKYYVWVLVISSIGLAILYIVSSFIEPTLWVRVIYPITMLLHLIIFYLIFNRRFPYSSNTKKVIFISIGLFGLFVLYQLIFNLHKSNVASDTFLVMSLLVTILILYYFFCLYNASEIMNFSQEPLFWVATGALFFYSSNIFATGLFHRLINSHKTFAHGLYTLNYLFGIAESLFGMFAIYLSCQKNDE